MTVVVAFGVLFPLVGGMETTPENTRFAFHPLWPVTGSLTDWLVMLGANLYFSPVTFTTLGYGDIYPKNQAAQVLAMGESLVGAALMALLVAVLSRRITR